MKEYQITTEIIINRNVSEVWQCLIDISNYQKWNGFITKLSGKVIEGSVVKMEIHPLGKRNQKFKVLVTKLEENKTFAWLGHFFMPGLIDGHHVLELIQIDNNKTKLIHFEIFKGLLVPFAWNSFILPRLKPGFLQFNMGLKTYLE